MIKKTDSLKFIALLTLLIGASFFLFLRSYAADGKPSLGISVSGTQSVGSTIKATVNMNAGGARVCTVSTRLAFSKETLQVTSISSSNSSYMTVPGASDVGSANSSGSINYEIGIPGCTTSNSAVYVVSFKVKKTGSTSISFSSAQVLGGENGDESISTGSSSANITINSNTSNKTTTSISTSTAASAAEPAKTLTDPAVKNVYYSPSVKLDGVGKTATGIILEGSADPGSAISITIHSDTSLSLTATADANGDWIAKLNQPLAEGAHEIVIKSSLNGVQSKEVTSNFVFNSSSKDQIALGTALPVATVAKADTNKGIKFNQTEYLIVMLIACALLGLIIYFTYYLKKHRANRYRPNQAAPIAQNIQPTASVGVGAPNASIAQSDPNNSDNQRV